MVSLKSSFHAAVLIISAVVMEPVVDYSISVDNQGGNVMGVTFEAQQISAHS